MKQQVTFGDIGTLLTAALCVRVVINYNVS